MKPTKQLISTAALTYSGFGVSILSAPLLARALEADGRGELATFVVVFQVLGWISYFGFPRGIALSLVQTAQLPARWFFPLAAFGVIGAGIFTAALTVLDVASLRQTALLGWAALLICFTGVAQIGYELVHQTGQFAKWNIGRFCLLVLPSVIQIALYFADRLSVPTSVVAILLGQTCWMIVNLHITYRATRGVPRSAPPVRSFSLKYWMSILFDGVGSRLDQVVLAAVATSSQLGVYAVAVTCASASGALTQALNHVAFPSMVAGRAGSSRRDYRRAVVLGFTASLVCGGLIVFVLVLFEVRIFGPTFDGLVFVAAILIVYQAAADQWLGVVYRNSAAGRGDVLAIASLCGVGLFGVASFLLIVTHTVSSISMAGVMVLMGVFRWVVGVQLMKRVAI